MKRIKNILLLFILTLSAISITAGNVLITTKMDSTLLLMGKKTTLHMEIVQDKGTKGFFINEHVDTLNSFVEVSQRLKADTSDLGNDREQINRDIIIQSFDSGMYVIPEFKYVVGNDTFLSNTLTLKVVPIKVDSLTTINDLKSIVEPPFFITDYLPDFIVEYWWLILIILIIVSGAVYAYIKLFKKGEIPFVKKEEVVLPPYDEAMMKLTQLKNEKLWEAGHDKEYFTRLTDILRNYIDRRFGINAMEMTSAQIIDILRKNEESHAVNEQLSKVLEMADFVKFAKMRPLPEDNEVAYQRAINFVNETKPVALTIEDNSNENKDGKEDVKND